MLAGGGYIESLTGGINSQTVHRCRLTARIGHDLHRLQAFCIEHEQLVDSLYKKRSTILRNDHVERASCKRHSPACRRNCLTGRDSLLACPWLKMQLPQSSF